jgi:hypothetical protein
MSASSFTWVRGGQWAPFGDGRVGLVVPGWDAIDDAAGRSDIRWGISRTPRAQLELGRAWQAEYSDPQHWRKTLVEVAGMGEWRLQETEAKAVLGRCTEIFDSAGAHWPGNSTALFDKVIGLLHDFGPLCPVERATLWNRGDGPYIWIDLSDLWFEIVWLGRTWKFLAANPPGSEKHEASWPRLKAWSRGALREVMVEPTWSEAAGFGGPVEYRVEPRTLRCYLWTRLFARFGRSPERRCEYCASSFSEVRQTGKRGPRMKYCELHRGSRFRQAVRGGYAPRKRAQLPTTA